MIRRRESREVVAAALAAIEAGQVSVEDLLLGGAIRSPRFRRWLAKRLQTTSRRGTEGVRIRNLRESAEVVRGILAAARRKFADHPAVKHITWGVKTRGDRLASEDCLIFLVDEKNTELDPKDPAFIGPFVTIDTGEATLEVATDIRTLAQGVLRASAVRPGFRTGVSCAGANGTLSCVCVDAAGVAHAVISGHVAKRVNEAVVARTVSGAALSLGSVVRLRDDTDVDGALVGPVLTSVGELSDPPASIRELEPHETRVPIRIEIARASGVLHAAVEVPGEPATFVDAHGNITRMNELTRLDSGATLRGDSGAPAFDDAGHLVGFVVGKAGGRTYLISAKRVIHAIV